MSTSSSLLARPAPPEPARRRAVAEALATPAALERLRPEWEALWRAAAASPFQSPAWLLPWWTHVGQGTPASVAVRCADGGQLVALAPLYVHADAATGRRRLFPLGIATSDRLDILVRPGWHAAVGAALAPLLRGLGGGWDLLEAPQLADGAALLALPWPPGWRRECVASEPNPVLPLPAALPPRMAQALAYARRRAARTGALAWEQADARSLPVLLDALDRLHARRWALRAQPGVLRAGGMLDWLRAAAPQLLAAGLLRLLALRLDGRLVAALLALADAPTVPQRRWFYYIGGFEPDVAALSPGTLLVGHAIDQAQADGAVAFDFLRGDEPYKQRWGAAPQPMHTLRVQPPGDTPWTAPPTASP